jgi:CPA2 family monovalent cation:H+ antiporter-2
MEGALHLTGITIVVLAAMICGMAMSALRQPPIVGYILAGVILGPSGLQLVHDREQVTTLAELGVLMLLFFIGMELSLRSFRRMWRLAILTTLIQIGVSAGAMFLIMPLVDWPVEQAVLFGFVIALSSTAVAVRMLEDIGELRTRTGRITVGVLIAQDLAVAPMLLIIGGMSGGSFSYWLVVKVAAAVAILTGVILFLSGRRKINLFFASLFTTKPDLVPVIALCLCFGFAVVAGLTGLSPPFGAFLAGLLVGSSTQRQHLYEMAKPIESILMMAFFLSIGLLIDLGFLWDNLGVVVLLWLFITVFKTALNTTVLHMLGERWPVAFLSSAVLAQIGEFSFVLGGAAMDRWIIGTEIHRLIVAVTVLSLISSPIYLATARRVQQRALHRIDTLKDVLLHVYSREWVVTRKASAGALVVVRHIAGTARLATDWAVAAPKGARSKFTVARAAASDAEKTESPPATAEERASDNADLGPGALPGRPRRRDRRSWPRPMGRPGRRSSGDT